MDAQGKSQGIQGRDPARVGFGVSSSLAVRPPFWAPTSYWRTSSRFEPRTLTMTWELPGVEWRSEQ